MTEPERHDLIIIGGGPAGLSAALTAESEGIDTLVIDARELGGQAGTSSAIENYPGFPEPVTGLELIGKMTLQATRFNTEFMVPIRATNIRSENGEGLFIDTDGPETYVGRVALLAIGVERRLLKARNLAAYIGRGVNYGSPNMSIDYSGQDVFIVGGANSAGQAAYHLSTFEACNVHVLVRGEGIENDMSGYLIEKLMNRPNIHIHPHTTLMGVDGSDRLERVYIEHADDGVNEMTANQVFVLIGSVPMTNWLPDVVTRDDQGYVKTGTDIPEGARNRFVDETGGRLPLAHETSMPGLFAAGDIRYGTNKRISLAVGDGAAVIPEIHRLRSESRH